MKRLKTKTQLQLNKSTIVDISRPSSVKGGGYTIDRSYCECPPLRL